MKSSAIELVMEGEPKIIYEKACSRRHSRRITDQCDCACSHTVPAKTPPSPADPIIWQVNSELSFFPVDSERWAILHPTAAGPALLNRRALALLHYFDSPRSVTSIQGGASAEYVRTALNDLIALSLLVPLGFIPPTPVETPETLSAWIHVTNACNLQCSYCYLHKTAESMNIEVGRRSIESVFRSAILHNYRGVQLKFAGGEPTLEIPLIIDLHRYAQELGANAGLALDSVILSNGTGVTRALVEELRAGGIRLMISMDGLGSFHNAQRPPLGGQGSAPRLESSIDELLEIGLVPDISVTVSNRNLAGLPEFIEWLLVRGLPFSLNYYRENDESAWHHDLGVDEIQMIEAMQTLFHVIESRLPHRSLLSSLVDLANLAVPHLRTCGVGNSYLVIDHCGNVAKCQMDIKQSVTTVMSKDPLAIVRANRTGIRNLPVQEKSGCETCGWRYWCAGGCPLLTYRATGRFDVKSPNCNIYKSLYPEVIRLEALRLSQYSNEIMASA